MKNLSGLTIWPLLLAGIFAYVTPATAQSYWDPGSTHGTGSGGTGTWNTGTPWWNGTADVAWPGGSAFFEGTAGTVTLGATEGASGLTFTTTGYTITGSTITLGGSPTIISIPSGTTTINSILAGSGGLTYSGSGTLVLGGVNTYTGGTTINGGTLQIAASSGIGAANGAITFANGGILHAAASLSDSGTITLNSGGGQVSAVTLSGTITGGGGLIINQGDSVLQSSATCNIGTLTMTGARLFISTSPVIAGAKIVAGASGADILFQGTAPTSPANTMSFVSGSILTARTGLQSPGTLTVSTANVTFPTTGNMTFNNDLDGTTTLPINVNGNWTLSGPLTIQLGGSSSATTGALTLNGVLGDGGNGYALTLNAPGTVASTIVLANSANSYSGGTLITGSKTVVQISSDGDLGGSAGGITFTGGGTLKNTAGISDSRAITLTSGGGTAGFIAMGGYNFTLSGTISGGGGLSVGGADFILQPTIANIGTFTETANRVFVSSANALGGTATPATVHVTGGILVFQNSAPTAPTNAMTFASGTSLTARNAGGYTGLTVNNSNNVTFPATGTMIFNNNGDNTASEPITVNGTTFANLTGPLTIQLGYSGSAGMANTTINGAIGGGGPLIVTAPGSAATLILGGTNTYGGNTAISGSGAALVIGGAGALGGGSYAGNITNSGTFSYNSSSAQILSGVISGSGTLNQEGAGTLTLAGANTYTGGTTVTGGILDGSVSLSIPPGSVTVNGGVLQLDTSSSMSTGVILNLASSPSNGAVNLNFTGTQNILALNFGSTSMGLGTWGAIGSSAINQSAAFTGSGVLNITGQNSYWDPGATGGSGSGGNGSWDNTTAAWFNGSSDSTWNANSVAFFEGTGGTVTLNASLIADGLTFTTSGYTISEGGSSPTLTLGSSPTVTIPSGVTTINAILAGTALTVGGSGSLVLGATNTYTGPTTIGAGSTLTINGSGELGSGAYSGSIAINGTALTNATSANQTWSGAISGPGTLTQSGPGQLLLTGANSYSGGTTITGGTLVITGANDNALGNTGSGITLAGGSTFYWSNSATYGPIESRPITLGAGGGNINVHNTYPYLNGQITGGNNLTVTGDDVILQSTANNVIGTLTAIANRLFIGTVPASYSVGFNITGGGGLLCFEGAATNSPVNAMTFASGTCLDNRLIGSTGATNLTVSTANATFPGAGTMIFNNDSQTPGTAPIVINGDYPTLTGALTIQVGSSSPVGGVTLNGGISGGYGLTKTLNGTLILAAVNSYTGGTIISAGILDGNASGSIPGNVTVNGGTLQLDSATAMSSGALTLPSSPANGSVNLNFAGTQTVSALNFGSTSMAVGTWGAIGSGANNQSAAFTGAGLLNVTSGGTSQTITFPSPGTQTYGVAPLTLAASASSSLAVTYTVISGPAAITGNTLTITGAGSVTVQATQAGNNIFDPALPASQTITVSPAPLTITADAVTKNYGTALTLAASAFAVSGLVTPDTVTAVTLTATGGTAATDPVSGSPYTITPSAAIGTIVPANYTITYVTNSLTVNPLAVILIATQAYDSTTNVYASTLSVSNVVSGDDVSLTNGPGGMAGADIGTNAITSLGTLALAGTTAANYSMTNPGGAVVVTPLPVTLTGTRPYDGTNDASSSILAIVTNYNGTNLTLSGSATLAGSSAGSQNISDFTGLTLDGTAATNYTLTGASGSVTITTVPLTITANPVSKTYGTAITLDPTTFIVGSGLVGSESVTAVTMTATPAGTAATDPAGIDTITPSAATGTGGFLATNYNVTYNTNTLTVNPLAVALTGTRPYDGTASAASTILSVANPVGSDDVSLASGTATLAGAAVGPEAITSVGSLALGGATAGNYTLAGATGTVTLTNPFNPITATSQLDITGTNFVVSWASVPGVIYNVLTNSSLNPPQTWASAGSVTATSTTTSFALPGGIIGNTNVNVVIQQQ